MTRLTAAVLATAAAAITFVGIAVSAAVDGAVRAEVAVAANGHPLDVHRIRIVDDLSPGQSYRLPAFGVRNHRGIRTVYRLVASADATQAERRPPQRWLRFVPPAVVIDAGGSRAVGVRLELPDDAESGLYGVALGIRPGGSEGARLTFRIEPAKRARAWLTTGNEPRAWTVPALLGAVLVLVLVRLRAWRRRSRVRDRRFRRRRERQQRTASSTPASDVQASPGDPRDGADLVPLGDARVPTSPSRVPTRHPSGAEEAPSVPTRERVDRAPFGAYARRDHTSTSWVRSQALSQRTSRTWTSELCGRRFGVRARSVARGAVGVPARPGRPSE